MNDCISNMPEIGVIPGTEAHTLEEEVDVSLKKLGVIFQRSSFKAGFELDFLIHVPGWSEINLELDGHKVHSVLLLDGDESIGGQAPYANRYRDSVLTGIGVEVVRLPVRDWLGVHPQDRSNLLAHRLEAPIGKTVLREVEGSISATKRLANRSLPG